MFVYAYRQLDASATTQHCLDTSNANTTHHHPDTSSNVAVVPRHQHPDVLNVNK
jgi:hypothetical protein